MKQDELKSHLQLASEIAHTVPTHLQTVAFGRVLDLILSGSLLDQTGVPGPSEQSTGRKSAGPTATYPTEGEFFSRLAQESGVPEPHLRDIFRLRPDGVVQVLTPTKDLGKSVANQAKTTITLVAGARAKGLGEHPVSGDAVRREVERKQCYQANNYGYQHLGSLKGFSVLAKGEILVTGKWLDEFKAAVATVRGDPSMSREA